MTRKYVAYIDEAGDEGISKLRVDGTGQSRWLILGGILVSEQTDLTLPAVKAEALSLFPNRRNRDLHFRELKHEQKVAVTSLLSQKRLGVCCVCSNKMTLLDGGKNEALFQQKGHLYNYLTRLLLERLSSAVAQQAARHRVGCELHVVFSRRANTDYHEMRAYFEMMRDGKEKLRPVRSIRWAVFSPENIKVENHSKWAGLQIADVAVSAMFSALEPNRYGHQEPRYALSLAKRLLSSDNQVHDCGFTLVPKLARCPLTDAQAAFAHTLDEVWRTPSP